MLVSPVNGKMAWNEFKKNKYRKCPVFHYRMMPFDPELLKRKLYNIRIEEIDDPTLGFLFREKRAEVDKMLTMLNERESKPFLYGSLQLYGAVSHKLLITAREILKTFPAGKVRKLNKTEYYNAREFAELARKELLRMKDQLPNINTKISFKDTIDFIKTFEILTSDYHFKPKTAFFIANRVHRGGGFTKDAIYLRGLAKLVTYLKEGHTLEPLLIGKIRQNYLPVIDELIERKILHAIRVKPGYLLEKEGRKRLSAIKKINKITDLINLE